MYISLFALCSITGPCRQAHKVAISIDPQHAEAFKNIGVLELRKGAVEQAKANFGTSATLAPHRY